MKRKWMKSVLTLVCALVMMIGQFGVVPQVQARTKDEKLKIACIGDSITWGIGLDWGGVPETGESYPKYMGMVMGDNYQVENFGACGYAMRKNHAYPYWNHSEFGRAKEFQPDIVVIMLGTNDADAIKANPALIDEFKADYKDMISEFEKLESKPKVYVATTPVPANGTEGTIADIIVPAEKEVAKEMGCDVIDVHAFTSGLTDYLADTAHLNTYGYARMADFISTRILSDFETDLKNKHVMIKDQSKNRRDSEITDMAYIVPDKSSPFKYSIKGGFPVADDDGAINKALSGNSKFTMDFWVYPNDLMTENTFVMKGDHQVSVKLTNKTLEFCIYNNGWYVAEAPFAYNNGEKGLRIRTWNHVAASYDGAVMRLYVNGEEVANKEANTTINSTDTPLGVGKNCEGNEAKRLLRGKMASLHIYNRALSAAEIKTEYNAQKNGGTGIQPNSDEVVLYYNASQFTGSTNSKEYVITSKFNGKALAIANGSTENNAALCQMSVTNEPAQIWALEDAGDGYFYIINKNSGKALDVPRSSTEQGTAIIQYDRNNNDNQKWKVEATDDGYYRITPKVAENFALDIYGYAQDDGAAVVQWAYSGAENQKWSLQEVGSTGGNAGENISSKNSKEYVIASKLNGKALAIANGSTENNAALCQMSVTKEPAQIWTLEDAGDGYSYIINKNSGKALDVPGGSTEQGKAIIQYDRNNNDNQKWKVEVTDDGYYRITPKVAGNLALDVYGNSQDDGAAIIQWAYSGAENQKWSLQEVGSLSEQIKNAAYGATVKLDRDYTEQVDILAGDSVILDLNGHRITSDTNKVIANWGTIKIIDSTGGGIIELETGDVDGNIRGIMNEPSAVLTIEGIRIHTSVKEGDPIAIGIHNKGSILKISNCEIKAETVGTSYSYGIWNEGTIDDISDGWFYGALLADHQNGHDSFAVYNNKGKVNISGGIFIGITRGAGYGYGICSAGTGIANLSGGSYYAVNGQCYKIINNNTFFEQAVATRDNGAINYMNGTSLTSNSDGARVVLGENQHYITFVDETELPMATYVMDNNGNIVKRMGNVKERYNVYIKNKTEVVTESDLSRYGSNTILYVNTGDHRETIYFLGSSVAQGTNCWNNSFADYLGDAYGDQVIIRKRALSGTPIADRDPWSYVKRMEKDINPNAKVDHLVVQLSTNDAGWANSPIGSVTAANEFGKSAMDKQTVVGAIEYITAYAQETWGCRVTFWTGPEYNSNKYKEMRSALLEQVYPKWKNHGMGILDFWTLWKPEAGDINPDGVHPYKPGYLKMTSYTYQYLKEFDAKVVSDCINQIGNVTEEGSCGERIAKARYLYDNMLNDAKQNVSNYQTLLDAEKKYNAYFEGTRKIDNATEVNVLSGPAGAQTENYTELFDGKIATKSGTGNFATTPYIWKVSSPIAIKYYKLTTANDNFIWKGRNPRDWKLYGSNDYDENGNGTWTEIASVSGDKYLEDENYYEALYKVNSPQRYSYYKWELTNENAGFLQMAEFTMYEDVNAAPVGSVVTITFNSDGGSLIDKQHVKKGERVTQPTAPTRDGYIFKGWYLGEAEYDFETVVSSDITLTAKWELKEGDVSDIDTNAKYRIVSKTSGKCLDVEGARADAGTNVLQWDITGGENQMWYIVSNEDGSYTLKSVQSGKVLDVEGASMDNGSSLIIWDSNNQDNQKWWITDLDNGYYSIISKSSGKSIDVENSSNDNGGNIIQWDYHGRDNQQWELEIVY